MKTTAVLTSMNHPIGMTVGNSLEVMEAIESLHGKGPDDLIELVATQGKVSSFPINGCDNRVEGNRFDLNI